MVGKNTNNKKEKPTQGDLGLDGTEQVDEDALGKPLEAIVLENAPGTNARYYHSAEYQSEVVASENKQEEGDKVYLAEFLGCQLKDIVGTMEYPVFKLSPSGASEDRVFTYKNITIKLSSGKLGLPTMHDKDVLIFIISQLMAIKNKQLTPTRKLSFSVSDVLEFCNRSNCGKGYKSLYDSLERLQATSMTTNIPWVPKKNKDKTPVEDRYDQVNGQSLLGEYKLKRYKDDDNRRLDSVEVEVSSWIYKAVMSDNVLTLDARYFELTPHEQRLYELARKHGGDKKTFAFKFDTVFSKSGCDNTKTRYRYQVKKIAEKDDLPEFHISLIKQFDKDTKKIVDWVSFVSRDTRRTKHTVVIPTLTQITIEGLMTIFPKMTSDDLHDLVGAYATSKARKKQKIENIDSEIYPYIIMHGEKELKKIKARAKKAMAAIAHVGE